MAMTGRITRVTQKFNLQKNSQVERHKATLAKLLAAIHRLQEENRVLRDRVALLEKRVGAAADGPP